MSPNRPFACAALAGAVLLAAAGCASTGRPALRAVDDLNGSGAFRRQADAGAFEPAWWRAFGDPVLEAVVAEALHANLDWRIALARVEQARAGARATATRLAPSIDATAVASEQRSHRSGVAQQAAPDVRALRGAFELGWEIDVFGAARAAADAARLDAAAAGEQAAGTRLLVAAEAARTTIAWQGARVRLEQLRALVEAQAGTERLTRSREAAGQASRFDVARAAAETRALEAQVPPLQTLVASAEHQLATLLGRSPSLPIPALQAAGPPTLPAVPPLPAGQPAELLERRPDLRAATRQLDAADARRREARADRLPRFLLSALLGSQDLRINAIDLGGAPLRNVALAFSWPLLDFGRLRALEDVASAREREAALRLERAVLGALQDVENSLVALRHERERAGRLEAAHAERRAAVRHAESLRREGQIDLLQLLDTQRGLIAAELALAEHRTQLALNGIQLYQALGGPWDPGARP